MVSVSFTFGELFFKLVELAVSITMFLTSLYGYKSEHNNVFDLTPFDIPLTLHTLFDSNRLSETKNDFLSSYPR
jgi:hypothetical protein